MKTLLLILVGFMTCPCSVIAQQAPLFQFTLYFEDSVGNRDSIVLGYDTSATSQGIDPQFGEVPITIPFDSIFEVRVAHGDDDEALTFKKIIEFAEGQSCIIGAYSKIIFSAKYPPVKITYDSTLFPVQSCENIILSRNWDMFFIERWWEACGYHCLAGSSGYTEYFVPPQPADPVCWNFYSIEKEVIGQGLKELPGLFLTTFYGPGPCNDPTFLHTDQGPGTDGAPLYPNPCGDYFVLETAFPEGIARLIVVNVAGEVMYCPIEKSLHKVRVDASGLQPGMYFVLVSDVQGKSFIQKVVKN